MDQPLGSRYLLHDMLGRGAMGQVYLASVRESETPVAVKLLKPELAANPELVARFIQERSILTSVSHPNVVGVIDLVVEGDTLAIVMEYVSGQDLRHHLRARGTLAPAEAVALTLQVLQGAAAVHAAGIVHRDIKPENLLLDRPGAPATVKLTDFGVARLSYGAALTKQTSLIGTPEYMAPELTGRGHVTAAVDLYAVGILLYEMLCGRTPFAGGHPLAVLRRHLDEWPVPISGLPYPVWDYIEWLLAKDAGARPASAAEAGAALVLLQPELAGLPALPPAAPAGPAPSPAGAMEYPLTGHRLLGQSPAGHSAGHPPTELAGHRPRTEAAAHPSFPLAEASGPTMTPWPAASGPGGGYRSMRGRPGGPPAQPGASAARLLPGVSRPGDGAGPSWPEDGPGRQFPGPAAYPATPPRSGRPVVGSRPALLALSAAVVVLAAAIGILLMRPHGGAAAAAAAARTVAYDFPPERYAGGMLVDRLWTLSGRDGSVLTEKVTVSGAARATRRLLAEPIPEGIASSLRAVHFTPPYFKVLRADPVVEWRLALPAHKRSITVGYWAPVPPRGIKLSRLTQWATAFGAMQRSLPGPAPTPIALRSLSISPDSLRLSPASAGQLALSGRLSTGAAAPQQILSGAAWTTGDAAVATVDSTGLVTAAGTGATTVTAQIGKASARVTVTVSQSSALAAGKAPIPAVGGAKATGPKPRGPTPHTGPTKVVKTVVKSPTHGATTSGTGGVLSTVGSTSSSGSGTTVQTTYPETAGTATQTWTGYSTGGGSAGTTISIGETVQVSCKVVGLQEATGNAYWYRISSSPWDNSYYAPTNDFYNDGLTSGSLDGAPLVDNNVPDC